MDEELSVRQARVSSNEVVSAAPEEPREWSIVTIALTDEQSEALEEITGERINELNIKVEELVDLADLIAN